MKETFIYSLAISVIYFLFKFLEMKFLPEEEKKPLKVIFKETLLVYFAAVLGIVLYSQFDITSLTLDNKTPMAFVDNPTF